MMTLRSRYDDAVLLLQHGRNEAALVMALIATAGAAKRHNDAKRAALGQVVSGDKNIFVQYFIDRGLHSLIENGVPFDLGGIVYTELRCQLIHESELISSQYRDGPFYLHMDGGKTTIGNQIINVLLNLVRKDPLSREDFRDLLSPYDNIVEFVGKGTTWELFDRLAEEFGVTRGTVYDAAALMRPFMPEVLADMGFQEMYRTIQDRLIPDLELAGFNGGFLTGLRQATGENGITDRNDRLTENGYKIIKAICPHYRTIDAAHPAA